MSVGKRHAFLLVLTALSPALAQAEAQSPSEAEARGLLADWLSAQNGGRLADYQRLYSPDFKGVRRSGERTQTFDRDGWLRDRARMFKKPMRVEARDVEVSLGRDGVTTLTFTQTFASGTFADEGSKRLTIRRYSEGLLVASEEMLSSRPKAKPLAPVVPGERDHNRAILFGGVLASKPEAEAARQRFLSQLADHPILYQVHAGEIELPGRVVPGSDALTGEASGWVVLLGTCSRSEADTLAEQIAGFAEIRVVPTSRWGGGYECPKPWPRPIDESVVVTAGANRKLEVRTYADKSTPLVSAALRDENGRAVYFMVRDAGQLLDDFTVSECSLTLKKKRGTVSIAYDCGGSMQDNCDWGSVSGVSSIRIDGDKLALDRVKHYRARRPRACGE